MDALLERKHAEKKHAELANENDGAVGVKAEDEDEDEDVKKEPADAVDGTLKGGVRKEFGFTQDKPAARNATEDHTSTNIEVPKEAVNAYQYFSNENRQRMTTAEDKPSDVDRKLKAAWKVCIPIAVLWARSHPRCLPPPHYELHGRHCVIQRRRRSLIGQRPTSSDIRKRPASSSSS